jgi:hypothetical protein
VDGQVFKTEEQTKCPLASNTPFYLSIYWKFFTSMLSIQLFLNFCTKSGRGGGGDKNIVCPHYPTHLKVGDMCVPCSLAPIALQSEHNIVYPNTYSRSSWNQIIVSCQNTRHRCPLQFPHMVKPYGIFQIDAY